MRHLLGIGVFCIVTSTLWSQAEVALPNNVVGETGETLVVATELHSTVNLGGWSWGVCSDPAVLQVVSSSFGDALAAAPPHFDIQQIFPDGCLFAGVYFGGFTYLPAGTHEMYKTTYQVVGMGSNVTTGLGFCATLGVPPLQIECVEHLSVGFLPVTYNGSITINPTPTFVRGDVNNDGGFSLPDPIELLSHLFQFGAAPQCLDAADADDDGSLQLPDVILLFYALFIPSAPQPVGPGQCDTDPTTDALDCFASACL